MSDEELVWTDRTKFAQLAEPLGVETDMILSARITNDKEAVVFYTPVYENEDEFNVYSAQMQRDNAGVWQLVRVPDFLPQATQQLKNLNDMLGDE